MLSRRYRRSVRDRPPVGDEPVADEPPAALRRRAMVQRWTDVVFLHWAYDPQDVQRLLPPGVSVDVHGGRAWVGLVSFRMEGLGFPHLAPLPLVGTFPEVNVRTYVRAGGRRAVWFFSLDVDRIVPVLVARGAYGLDYCAGRVAHGRVGDIVTTSVERRWPRPGLPATTAIAVRTGSRLERGDPLPTFLTARWALVSATRRGRLRHAPIRHAAWPLHGAEVLHLDDRLVTAAGLPAPTGAPLAMWSPGVDVDVGWPRRLRT
jgi:uncharacterized protein YqjF (DUF2071 family)